VPHAKRERGIGDIATKKGIAMRIEIEGGRLRYRFDYCGI